LKALIWAQCDEIGAFTEAELLAQGTAGTNIGRCDTFVMPANTCVTIEVEDNDSTMSGDNWCNENANDRSGQTAEVWENGVLTSSGEQIYAESYFWVRDQCGHWYIMIEMELENTSGDYFTFYNNVPPEGAVLTIYCERNVTCNWVKYCKLMEPDCTTPPLADDDFLTIAEDETGTLNLLANDFDIAGDLITVTGVSGGDLDTPFVVQSAQGWDAMVTLQADGTMSVTPGPEFLDLAEGQSSTLSFTYTITDSEGLSDTATVTITVEGKSVHIANNDVLTVSESEGANGVDLLDSGAASILANDTTDGGSYGGDVEGVNGDASNIGITVAGSNGGLATIYANGSIDFDANGEFDDLGMGEMAVTEFTYAIAGGDSATITVNVEGESDAGSLPTINLAIMLNSALSMFEQADTVAFSLPRYQDWNGNSVDNEVMDMAYLMVADFMAEAHADAFAAGYSLNLALISFDDTASGEGGAYYSVADAASAGAQLDAKIAADNAADYGAGFSNAQSWFDDVAGAQDTNGVFVIGNGFSSDAFDTALADLKSAHDVSVDAFLPDAVSFGVLPGQSALSLDDLIV